MKQNVLQKLMLIAVLLTGSYAFAHDFEVDGIYYNILSENDRTIEVTYKGNTYYEFTDDYSGYIVIPGAVTFNNNIYTIVSIGDETFRLCKDLVSITIPNSVTSIGYYVFAECNELSSIIVEKGNPVFDSRDNCNAIIATEVNKLKFGCKNTVIPNSVISIGGSAFHGCQKLTTITIPDAVIEIYDNAFLSCTGLTSVSLGTSVNFIEGDAFSGCDNIAKIYCKSTTPPTTGNTKVFPQKVIQHATLYVPTGCKSTYKSADFWSNFSNIEETEFSAIEATLTDNSMNVYVENGNIVVNGADNANIEVYNVNGQCIYNGMGAIISMNIKGIYIVKIKDKTFKVVL